MIKAEYMSESIYQRFDICHVGIQIRRRALPSRVVGGNSTERQGLKGKEDQTGGGVGRT
jgi:hypothetical protein